MAGLNDVATKIAKENNLTVATAKVLVTEVLDTIIELTEEGSVRIGKHTFKSVERKARTCRNPRTGEAVEVAAKTIVTYKYAQPKSTAVAPPPEPTPKKKIKK
jgi:nucleoid DNA-binding protein